VARKLKVAIAQVPVTMGDKRANLRTLFTYLEGAARAGCDVAVFPECSLTGWLSASAPRGAEPIPGPFVRRLQALARRRRMAIVGGFEERDGRRLYNSAVFIGKDGRLLLRHRKIDELAIGLKVYSRGGALGVAEFEGRTAGLDICADSWGPQITDALYLMGARIIFSPCAWAVDRGGEETNIAWILETYRSRIGTKDLTIVTADGVGPVTEGPWKGRILQGNSLVIGPGGEKLLQGPANTPALLTLKC
jgi:predicted amidohydrolase